MNRVEQRWAVWRYQPLGCLFRHSFARLFETEDVNSDAGNPLILSIALLAAPGFIMSVLLYFMKYSPLMRFQRREFHFDRDAAAVTDKFYFLLLGLLITGLVAIMRYQALFPDRRDFWNLAPLPVPLKRIFVSKFVALLCFLGLVLVMQNAIPSVLFPLAVMQDGGSIFEFVRFVVAHAVAVTLESVFVFCATLAVVAWLMIVLPYATFRRLSRYLKFGGVSFLLLVFFLSPLASKQVEVLRRGGNSFIEWMPSVWFLGLYEQLHGKPDGLARFAGSAIPATLLAIVAAALGYGLVYRKQFLQAAETQDLPLIARDSLSFVYRLFDRSLLRTPFDRGSFRFAVKTLLRSERHVTILGAALGLASALSVQALSDLALLPSEANAWLHPLALAIPATIIYFLNVGLRIAFGIPSDPAAAWVFRAVLAREVGDSRSVARNVMYVATAPVLAVIFAAYAIGAGLLLATLHVIYLAAIAATLIEALLRSLRGIPFTTPMNPGGGKLVPVIGGMFAIYLAFTGMLVAMERVFLFTPTMFFTFYFLLGMLWFALHRTSEHTRIEFEPQTNALELLRLSE